MKTHPQFGEDCDIHFRCLFPVALAEFQDHGLQSAIGDPQHGSGLSGSWWGNLVGQRRVRRGGDPRSAPATSTEKSVLHSNGVHSRGGSREGCFGFRRPVSYTSGSFLKFVRHKIEMF